jgi:hypothetical protein
LRKAPDSFESISTSFSAALAAAAVACSLARPSGAPPAPVVETRMSEKLKPPLAGWADLLVVEDDPARSARTSAAIEGNMDRLLVRFVAANVVPLSKPKLKTSETRPTPDAVASPQLRD